MSNHPAFQRLQRDIDSSKTFKDFADVVTLLDCHPIHKDAGLLDDLKSVLKSYMETAVGSPAGLSTIKPVCDCLYFLQYVSRSLLGKIFTFLPTDVVLRCTLVCELWKKTILYGQQSCFARFDVTIAFNQDGFSCRGPSSFANEANIERGLTRKVSLQSHSSMKEAHTLNQMSDYLRKLNIRKFIQFTKSVSGTLANSIVRTSDGKFVDSKEENVFGRPCQYDALIAPPTYSSYCGTLSHDHFIPTGTGGILCLHPQHVGATRLVSAHLQELVDQYYAPMVVHAEKKGQAFSQQVVDQKNKELGRAMAFCLERQMSRYLHRISLRVERLTVRFIDSKAFSLITYGGAFKMFLIAANHLDLRMPPLRISTGEPLNDEESIGRTFDFMNLVQVRAQVISGNYRLWKAVIPKDSSDKKLKFFQKSLMIGHLSGDLLEVLCFLDSIRSKLKTTKKKQEEEQERTYYDRRNRLWVQSLRVSCYGLSAEQMSKLESAVKHPRFPPIECFHLDLFPVRNVACYDNHRGNISHDGKGPIVLPRMRHLRIDYCHADEASRVRTFDIDLKLSSNDLETARLVVSATPRSLCLERKHTTMDATFLENYLLAIANAQCRKLKHVYVEFNSPHILIMILASLCVRGRLERKMKERKSGRRPSFWHLECITFTVRQAPTVNKSSIEDVDRMFLWVGTWFKKKLGVLLQFEHFDDY